MASEKEGFLHQTCWARVQSEKMPSKGPRRSLRRRCGRSSEPEELGRRERAVCSQMGLQGETEEPGLQDLTKERHQCSRAGSVAADRGSQPEAPELRLPRP